MRDNNNWMAGRIWPAGRILDIPSVEHLIFTIAILKDYYDERGGEERWGLRACPQKKC